MTKYLIGGLGASALAALGYFYKGEIEEELLSAEDYLFMEHVTKFGKSYATKKEFNMRAGLFKDAVAMINEWNNDATNTHKLAVNHLTDLTQAERKRLTGFKPNMHKHRQPMLSTEHVELADGIDWRAKGAVNPVQDQGMCGSCWAFSATAAVESAYFINHGTLVKCSEQQLVDCDTTDGGCNGGAMENAFEYIEKNPLMLLKDYPYSATGG